MPTAKIPVKIPLTLMSLTMVGLLILPFVLVQAASDIVSGAYGSPSVLLVVHTLVIGILFSAIIGVFYQLGPVAFVTISVKPTLAFSQALVFVASGISFLVSWEFLVRWGMLPLAISGTVLVVAILGFLAVVVDTVRRRTTKDQTTWFVLGSVGNTVLLITAALILVWGMAEGWFYSDQWVGAHALAGVYGIFVQFAIGFGYKLMPMFQLSHVSFNKRPYWIWSLLNGALLLEDAGLLVGSSVISGIGAFGLLAALVLFVLEVREIYKKRIRKAIEWPLRAVLISWAWLIVGTVLLFVWQWTPGGEPQLLEITFVALVVGGLGQMVSGFLYKIIPFLIWTTRYGAKVGGTAGAPALKDSVRKIWARAHIALWNVAVLILMLAIGLGVSVLVDVSAAVFLLGVLIGLREWWRVISPRGVFPVQKEAN